MSIQSMLTGWFGEVQGVIYQKLRLDPNIYICLNDTTLDTPDGTTQIDHIIVSRYGIFVIESKNIDGWIFGNERDAQWTVSRYGNKTRMQNPLRQNYRHTKALSEYLKIDHNRFFSVVWFWGEVEFKTPMPPNVVDTRYAEYIKSKTDILFTHEEAVQIAEAIRTGRLPQGWKTRFRHVASLKERHNEPTRHR